MWTCSHLGAVGALASPDLHGFYRWVFDTLGLLNIIVKQEVVVRRDSGLLRWAGWLREDLSSRP